MNPGTVNCKTPFSNSCRPKKSHELREHLLFCVIFTVGGSGLMNAQQMQYVMLVSILPLGL
uniref:Uncharacterized protein n=1 Tax=Arundo donax TaxID=35708 RepID=A0A0A9F6Z9_ARUDO